MIFNQRQQDNLFKLLNFSMPQMNFSMPGFDSGRSSSTVTQNYFTVSSGDVNLHDQADIRTFFNEKDTFVKRMQSRSGVKQR